MARTVDAIYLRKKDNIQGEQKLMDLSNGILITRPKFYSCVMTKIVIKAVEKPAESQGFKTLKTIARGRKLFFLIVIFSQEYTGYTMIMK